MPGSGNSVWEVMTMLHEDESTEFKLMLTDDICKPIVAFANTSGGTIYIGIDDQGHEAGVTDIDAAVTRLANIVRDAIWPDVTLYTQWVIVENRIIKVIVGEGTAKPYYIKKNGIKPSGVYVRQGASSVQASWEQIRQLIKSVDGDLFEEGRSLQQDMTFTEAQSEFDRLGVAFSDDKHGVLGIRDMEKGVFTNLALLLSDQCRHTIKVAVFEDPANTVFIDRREFSGSVFKQLHDTYAYLMLNNRTKSAMHGLERTDRVDYPPEAIREVLLNALVHRDYSYSGSIMININRSSMAFVSLGGLMPGLTRNDIMTGISQPRNPKLAHVFYRLKHIEAYGTGIRRIFALYDDCDKKPEIVVTENTFRLELPNRNDNGHRLDQAVRVSDQAADDQTRPLTGQMKRVLDYIAAHESISDEAMMTLLGTKKTRTYLIARQMAELGLIAVVGRGRTKKYVLRH